MLVSAGQLRRVAPRCDAEALAPAADAAAARFGITTPLRLAHWVAQMAVESWGFTRFSEDLDYSAEALTRLWPLHFPPAIAAAYARNPARIADRAYANRMGNGDEASGDGWAYRGRGPLDITGRAQYLATGAAIGLDLVGHPELLEQPGPGFLAAGAFWAASRCNGLADRDDLRGVTLRINGGLTDLKAREDALRLAKTLWPEKMPAEAAPGQTAPAGQTRPAPAAASAPPLPAESHPPMSDAAPADPQVQIPSFIQANILSFARAGLVALGAELVRQGLISQAQEAQLVSAGSGLALIAAGAAWIWIKNKVARRTVVAALNAPPPAVPAK